MKVEGYAEYFIVHREWHIWLEYAWQGCKVAEFGLG
jgi:hypothetical protein